MTPPLKGLTVVEMATYITGPYTTMLLADFGADVIKIEHPQGGDPFRQWVGEEVSPRFVAFNRSKQSMTLDLRHDSAREACHLLLRRADVFVENFRPGVTARLGVDYPTVRALNPKLIHLSITGRGDDGPDAALPTYDAVGQAMSGLMSLYTDMSNPQVLGPAMSDALSGLVGAYGVLAALHARSSTGVGQHVRTSMLQATLGFLVEPVSHYVATGEVPGPRTRAHQSQSYAFTALDNRALVIHLSTPQKFWEQLIAAVDRADLLHDPALTTYGDRVRQYDEIRDRLRPTFAQRTRDEWLTRLQANDVPCAPVNTIGDVFDDPQVRHLGLEILIPGANGAPSQRAFAPPLLMEDLPEPGPVPELGQHTEEILASLGYDRAHIAEMRRQGAA